MSKFANNSENGKTPRKTKKSHFTVNLHHNEIQIRRFHIHLSTILSRYMYLCRTYHIQFRTTNNPNTLSQRARTKVRVSRQHIQYSYMTLKRTNAYFVTITTLLLALLTAMSPFAIDTYLAAMPTMATFFGVGINKIEISLTIYFLGFALGNFFGGPLSDSFGRKPIALTGIALYLISALLITLTKQIEMLWLFRCIQAFGGGFASVTAMVFVRDWFTGKQVAKMATLIGMIMMFAPLVAPVVGTFLLELGSWKYIFYFLTIYGTVLYIVFGTQMPESRPKELITKQLTLQQLIGKYTLFFSNRKAVMLLLATAFSMAGMFTFITSSSFMYLEYYGFSRTIFPLLFGANVILNVVFSLSNTLLLKRFEPITMLRIGLSAQLVAGIVLLIAVHMAHPPFFVVFSSIVLYIGSLGMVFGNSTALILNLVPQVSGSANAMIGVTRFVISFIAGTIPAILHTGTLLPIGITILMCTLVGNLFFYRYRSLTNSTSDTITAC
ncbi:MAG: hypothetical protein RIS47_1139 [Bacteroidota bacterium]